MSDSELTERTEIRRRAGVVSSAAFALIAALALADVLAGGPHLILQLLVRGAQAALVLLALVLVCRGARPPLIEVVAEMAVLSIVAGSAVSAISMAEPGAGPLLCLAIALVASLLLPFRRGGQLRLATAAALTVLATAQFDGAAHVFQVVAALILLAVLATDAIAIRGRAAATADDAVDLRAFAADRESLREEERRRLARRLHDDVAQPMAALGLGLGRLGRDPSAGGESTIHLKELESLVRSTVVSLQTVMADLRPSVLDDFGLAAAVREEARRFGARRGVECLVHADPGVECSDDSAVAAFRIVQDTLAYAAAQGATLVEIDLGATPGSILIDVSHDGAVPSRAEPPFDLLCLRQRVLLHGGSIRFDTTGAGEPRLVGVIMELPRGNVSAGQPTAPLLPSDGTS